MRHIRLPQRVHKVLERKTIVRRAILQDAGNTVTTLKTCAYEVHNYTSKMQSDTQIANRPLPQQRQVKTATHKMQDDQVVVSTVRSSRGVSIFCQRLDGAEPQTTASYEAVPSNDKPRGHGNNKKEWGPAPESIYALPMRVDEIETKVHGCYLALIYILLEGRHEENHEVIYK